MAHSFDMLNLLDATELKQLLNNDAKVNELIADHPLYRGLKDKRNELIMENRSIAEYTVSREQNLKNEREKFIRSQARLLESKKEFEREKRNYSEFFM
jgi:Modifier of rudimentary (Mod(r)) protein